MAILSVIQIFLPDSSSVLSLWWSGTQSYSTSFLYQVQECDLRFASWSHDVNEIDLNLITDKGDLSSYMNNSEFDLIEMKAIRVVIFWKNFFLIFETLIGEPLSNW